MPAAVGQLVDLPYAWSAGADPTPTFTPSRDALSVGKRYARKRQISFEALIAFGMTLVIVTGGIALSVGSLVARGLAFILCAGQPIYELPPRLLVLGRGFVLESVFGKLLPVPVLIMLLGFVTFHVLLARTVFGRGVIAVGSNEEAARLAGIPVRRTKPIVYALTGALIIGVLNNSLNLLHVEHFWQKVVLGLVILLAALFDAALRRVGRQ
ncbi:MAG: hypothetical protein V2A79_13070 [Planctomycetota bacterium]